MLDQLASSEESEAQSFYNCPVCRKPHVFDLEALHVDTLLGDFIDGITAIGQVSISGKERVPWGIIRPQPALHKVCVGGGR